MSFAARAQASHARLRGHFGSVSVVIRQGSGSGDSTMTVTSRAPIPVMVDLEDGVQRVDKEIKFDHADPGRTFVPEAGHWASVGGDESLRVDSVRVHEADNTISYTLRLRGHQ